MSYTVTVEQVYRQTVEVPEAVSESDAVEIALCRVPLYPRDPTDECVYQRVLDVASSLTPADKAERERDRWR